MAKGIVAQEAFEDLSFPLAGIDVSRAFGKQMPRPMQDGSYARTTPSGINVRAYEPSTNRARGAQRCGLSKYVAAQVGGSSGLIQCLHTLVGSGYTPPGGGSSLGTAGRVVTLVAVKGGSVFVSSPDQAAWVTVGSGLASSGVIHAAQNGLKLYFADGTSQRYYDPVLNQTRAWTATAGTLPEATDHSLPRLICTWRGRTVLSGISGDGQNWFMSRVNDPFDWDYAPLNPDPSQPIAGNASPLGLIGDMVTSLCPWTDDVLILGGDHTLWTFSGDPGAGGQIDLVSDTIGMAWGIPWCKGPDGTVYFVSNRMGVYAYRPGSAPARLSQPIEQLLLATSTGTKTIRLLWDERFQGLHVFATTTASSTADTHLFWEARSGAWWQDSFTDADKNPLAVAVFDGNDANDRRPLLGGRDGYVRAVDPDATDDDGTAVQSSVTIGPMVTKDFDELLLKDIQAVLATGSGTISWAVHVGRTAEAALASSAVASGTWTAGRNLQNLIRRSGHAIYLKLSATAPWALEGVRCRLAAQGKIRRRY